METLGDWVAASRRRLISAGVDPHDAALDVEVLARHALGWSRARWLSRLRDPAPPELDQAGPLVARRRRREPVAQIIGSREFWGLDFEVTSDVLTPRPETELLVEAALTRLDDRAAVWSLADVGTGSGCLAVALSHELPRARLAATDISAAALRVARRNAARHGAAGRIAFHETPFLEGLDGPYDLIVSNPPYITDHEMATLPLEVGRHEPGTALRGGRDGLDPARAIAPAAAARLRPGGWLLLEIGVDQGTEIGVIAIAAGLDLIEIARDLRGVPRVAVMRARAEGAGHARRAIRGARSCSDPQADAGECETPSDPHRSCS